MIGLLQVIMQEEEAEHHAAETHSWILPEGFELLFGGIASVAILGTLIYFVTPMVKKFFSERTARIQAQLDGADAAKTEAQSESTRIREAKGDIESERARLLADADAQAEQLLVDGRARLAQEVADLESKADADLAQLATRSGEELRAEITRLSGDATDRLVADVLDDSTQQQLIEQFIARVGAAV